MRGSTGWTVRESEESEEETQRSTGRKDDFNREKRTQDDPDSDSNTQRHKKRLQQRESKPILL